MQAVILVSFDLHAAWVNSRAMEVAGITKDTPDPPGGIYVRDKDGNPTGYVNEASAMVPIVVANKAITPEAVAGSLERVLYGLVIQVRHA